MNLRPLDPSLAFGGTEDDPRLGSRLVPAGERAPVVLLGCADDTGVRNGAGRGGSALGPTEIRRWLYRQSTGLAGELAGLRLADMGDVLPSESIEETHREIESAVAGAARDGAIVIFLGGGSDLSYGSQSGLFEGLKGKGAVLNVDARMDARPLKDGRIITSGTPFRRLIERWGDRLTTVVELGIQPHHVSAVHAAYLKSKRARIATLEELRQAPGPVERFKRELGAAFGTVDFAGVTLDLAVAAAAFAPGVSTPSPDGLSAEEVAKFADWAGRNVKVRLLDVVEVAPPHDENGRTARLAALCVWRFLAGLATRPQR